MTEYMFDIILILISGSACLYCWMLNRRLKALQDMKKGLGASIINLSAAISKTSIAAQEAKASASESVEELRALLAEVDASIPKMEMMLESLERSSRRTMDETKTMQRELVATLRPLLEEAHDKAGALAVMVNEADKRAERRPRPAAAPADTEFIGDRLIAGGGRKA